MTDRDKLIHKIMSLKKPTISLQTAMDIADAIINAGWSTVKCEDCAGCTSWFCDCANIYRQCVEDIKAFYKENKFAYEAQTLAEELDEFLETRTK